MAKHVCPWWFAYSFDNPLRTLFHKPDQIFAPHIKNGMTVADIGCGFGYFSIQLAKRVQENGKVIAVDIQQKMLDTAQKRAVKASVSDIIHFQQCSENNINITEPLDYALAFWMIHETPEVHIFLKQIYDVLKPAGLFLMAEPKFHVSHSEFQNELDTALEVGFTIKSRPSIKFSFSAVLEK